MGLFDRVQVAGEAFRCSEGHDLSGQEFQTKDLGCTMGHWLIADRFSGEDGGFGDPPEHPFSGSVEIYAECSMCPAFVQAGTFNLCPCVVEFMVKVVGDEVQEVRRTSPDTGAQVEAYPKEKWMKGCLGPIPYDEAERVHLTRVWPPSSPTPPPKTPLAP